MSLNSTSSAIRATSALACAVKPSHLLTSSPPRLTFSPTSPPLFSPRPQAPLTHSSPPLLCRYAFTVVFVYHTATQGVTLLREFAQAAPPHGAFALTLPCGGFDPKKHASVLDAAKAELSEEAQLCGGTWHSLLPDGHPGVLESKWCRNRFTMFLCVDPSTDTAPAARDAEEQIEILSEWPVQKVIEAMESGEMLLHSLQTCVSALAWLRRAEMLPKGL